MTDYTELKRLAEACVASGEYLPGAAWEEDRHYGPDEEAFLAFVSVATPAAVLALIAENERLKTLRSKTERELAQELEVWRHGPSCWNCGDTGDVHDIVGEWRGKCDCFAAHLIGATQEGDQLRAEVAGLRTGYEAYERVNAELKAEVDALRKALTSSREFLVRDAKVRRMTDGARHISPMFPLRKLVMEQIDAALGQGEQS